MLRTFLFHLFHSMLFCSKVMIFLLPHTDIPRTSCPQFLNLSDYLCGIKFRIITTQTQNLMHNTAYLSRAIAAVLGLLWVHIEPSINFITVCFFALIIDCYTAWRCNRRIYEHYREQIKKNPKCKMDGKLRSKKMAKMVWTFSVLIMCVCLASYLDRNVLGYMNTHLANQLTAMYCLVQFVSILENESTCNGAAWARFLQKIVADKTERHFNVKLKELMKEKEEEETAE